MSKSYEDGFAAGFKAAQGDEAGKKKPRRKRKVKRVGPRKKKDVIGLFFKTMDMMLKHRVTFIPFVALCVTVASVVMVDLTTLYPIHWAVWMIAVYVICELYREIPEGESVVKLFGKKTRVKNARFTEQ